MTPLGTAEHLLIITTRDGITGRCNCGQWHHDGNARTEVQAAHRQHLEAVVSERYAEWERENA